MVTGVTTGFGDYFPNSGLGRFVGSIACWTSLLVLTFPINIIGGDLKVGRGGGYGGKDREGPNECVATHNSHDYVLTTHSFVPSRFRGTSICHRRASTKSRYGYY